MLALSAQSMKSEHDGSVDVSPVGLGQKVDNGEQQETH